MDNEKAEEFLIVWLEKYMSMDYNLLPNVLGYHIKQYVGRDRGMIFKIYSNDHNPPHFHVMAKDGSLDAKFRIDNCEIISGEVSTKDMKRIEAFFIDAKEIMKLMWNKRN